MPSSAPHLDQKVSLGPPEGVGSQGEVSPHLRRQSTDEVDPLKAMPSRLVRVDTGNCVPGPHLFVHKRQVSIEWVSSVS